MLVWTVHLRRNTCYLQDIKCHNFLYNFLKFTNFCSSKNSCLCPHVSLNLIKKIINIIEWHLFKIEIEHKPIIQGEPWKLKVLTTRNQQWLSDSVLKTGRREELSSNTCHARQPNRSEVFVIFLELRCKYLLGSLRKTSMQHNPSSTSIPCVDIWPRQTPTTLTERDLYL